MAAEKKKPLSLNERHDLLLRSIPTQKKKQQQPSSSTSQAPTSNPPPPQPQPEESMPVKVKVQGRRRLCKLSSKNDADDDDGVGGGGAEGLSDGPSFSGITDFDSPPPVKIRDIVDDISSKLESLSIQKFRVNKEVGTGSGSTPIELNSETLKKSDDIDDGYVDVPEYASAGSSFSGSPDKAPEARVWSESDGDDITGEVKVENRLKGDCKAEVIEKDTLVLGHQVVYGLDDDDEEDDCVVLGNNGPVRDGGSIGDLVSGDEDAFTLTGKTSTYMLPGTIAKMLYPHQRDGLKWLWSLHCRGTGGILGDDMGLGKTMQVCSFLAGLFHSSLIKRVLVVAPKTLLAHWNKELSLVGLSEKTREYFAPSVKLRQYELQYILQNTGVLLTTYDIVRNNSKSLRGDCSYDDERDEDNNIWDYIILDEGHIIKNPSTQRAKSLLELPSSHRIIISGTPIQNNLKELWALFSFCCPELLGDKKEFKDRYESKILCGNDKNATARDKRIGSTVAKELRERIEPYFLRRMKSEVSLENDATKSGKLSEKNEMIVWLRLTHCQRQLYEAFLNSELVTSSFDGSPLAAITVLKKICDHPLLLTQRAAEDVLEGIDSMDNQEDFSAVEKMVSQLANASYTDDSQRMQDNVSCKISFIISLLNNLIPDGHKVLIFSQTRKMLNLVQEAITLKGYKFLRIDGTTKASDREKTVNDFQEGVGAPIFLLTSQVGGLGLTLTKADRVIVVDPAWNPSTDNQSVDRAYRIGQKKDVIVYRLMTCGTIEEKIYKMQVYKGSLLKTATEHKEQTRYFSKQDLRELFRLPAQGFDVSLTQQQLHEEHDRHHVMDDYLKNHIKFLESQGIAGVSHHNLLFSKTEPPVEDIEITSKEGTYYVGSSYSNSSLERGVDGGAEYAFNPKEVKLAQKSPAATSAGKRTESDIKDRIKRLEQTLADKAIVSKLPDRGQKIQRQIFDLNAELDKIKLGEKNKSQFIDIDDLSEELQRVYV